MSNQSGMKGGASSMEQARVLVQILEELRQQNAMLQSAMNTLREQSRQKDEEIERLRQIILNLQRAQFGQRSEKRTYVLDDGNQQLSLFDTPEKSEEKSNPEPSQNPEKEICVSGHSRKKKRTLEELCATLPVEERIVDLPDNEKVNPNGHALTCIGQEYIRTELVLERAKARRLSSITGRFMPTASLNRRPGIPRYSSRSCHHPCWHTAMLLLPLSPMC